MANAMSTELCTADPCPYWRMPCLQSCVQQITARTARTVGSSALITYVFLPLFLKFHYPLKFYYLSIWLCALLSN